MHTVPMISSSKTLDTSTIDWTTSQNSAKVKSGFLGHGPGEMKLCEGEDVEVVTRGPSGGWSRGIFGSFPTDCVELECEVAQSNFTDLRKPEPPRSSSSLQLRTYQLKVLETAEVLNTIAFLPTGAGKTLIAVHLIKKRLAHIRSQNGQNRQVIAFLAPTKILVGQQRRYIESHCDACVMEFTGDTSSVEGSSHSNVYKSNWRDIFANAELIVMTPEILKQLLHRKVFTVSSFDTLIIDECHHAFGSNAIVSICSFIAESGERRPIIFGMTASPIACKSTVSVATRMSVLERNLHCKLLCSEEMLREFRELVPLPQYRLHRFPGEAESSNPTAAAAAAATLEEGSFKYVNNATFILDRDNALFPPESFSLSAHVMRTLHYAYIRTKTASQLCEIYRVLRTAHLQPADVPELESLHLPSHDMMQRLRLGTVTDGDVSVSTTAATAPVSAVAGGHMLNFHRSHRFHALNEVTQDIGKVLSIAEECGILCALHALRICLTGGSIGQENAHGGGEINPIEGIQSDAITATGDCSSSSAASAAFGALGDTFSNDRWRVNYIHQTDSQHLTSSVDLDRVSVLGGDIAASPFAPLQLVHAEYLACVSLLDVFTALAAAMGPLLCLSARSALEKQFSSVSLSVTSSINGAAASDVAPFASPSVVGTTDLEVSGSDSASVQLTDEEVKIGSSLVQKNDLLSLLASLQSAVEQQTDLVDLQQVLAAALSGPCTSSSSAVLKQMFTASSGMLVVPPPPAADSVSSLSAVSGAVPLTKSMPLIHHLVCLLLTAAADQQTSLSLSVEGVLTLLPDFCAQHCSSLTLTAEEVIVAISDACTALIDCISAAELKQLLMSDTTVIIRDPVEPSPESGSSYAIREVYSTVSNKVRSLYRVWQDLNTTSQSETEGLPSSQTKTESASGIVFCRMRLTAVALSNLLFAIMNEKASSVPVTDRAESGVASAASSDNPLFITGQMRQQQQLQALQRFRSEDCCVLFATDVVEEGLDVRVCQYVIHFDLPSTVKSFIQRRGRARASGSVIVALIPEGREGDRMVRELQAFEVQEREMELYAQKNAVMSDRSSLASAATGDTGAAVASVSPRGNSRREVEAADLDLIDPVRVMESVIAYRLRGDATLAEPPTTLEDGEVMENLLPVAPTVAPALKLVPDVVKPLEKYVVPSTGVQVDERTSAQLLLQFCQMLPHDTYYSPRPIFWMTTTKEQHRQQQQSLNAATPAKAPPSQTKQWFRCSILLPPALPPLCRCVVGPLSENKASAKGLAALDTIKLLHQQGELNDFLMTNGSKQADKMERETQLALAAKAQSIIDAFIPATDSASNSADTANAVGVKRDRANLIDDPELLLIESVDDNAESAPAKKKKKRPATPPPDAELLRILVKTVPDCLTQPPTTTMVPDCSAPTASNDDNQSEKMIELFMYAVRCDFIDDQTREITLDCPSCSTNFKAINEFGIAFTRKLPSDVFQSVFDCNLRESECLVVKMELLEQKRVSRRELFHMQRFHRAVLCSESECKRYRKAEFEPVQPDPNDIAGIPDEIWLPHNADLSQYTDGGGSGADDHSDPDDCERRRREQPVDHDSWRASANGAWYCIFPLPEDMYERENGCGGGSGVTSEQKQQHSVSSLLSVKINRDPHSTFHDPLLWYQYLRQSADEAQILLHNLRMQESLNRQDLDEYYPPFLHHAHTIHQMTGLLVSRGSGGVFWVGEQDTQPELQKCLASVIKFVRPDHPENVAITTFVPVANAKTPPRMSSVYAEMMREESRESSGDNAGGADAESSSIPPEQTLIPMTFADHFLQKYPKYASIIRQLEKDTSLRLVKVQQITSRLTLTYLLGRSYNNKLENKRQELCDMTSYSPFIPVQPPRKVHVRVRRPHSHCSPIYLLPDLCRPLGKVKWMSIGSVAPSIIWRIQSLLHSVEARERIASILDEFRVPDNNLQGGVNDAANAVTVPSAACVPSTTIAVAASTADHSSQLVLPRASIMLEALTPRLAKENLDSERLELLGDSLLKLVTTDELFRIYPNKHEGFLTSQRAKIISNMHLTDMCLKLGLDRYLRGFPLSTGKQQLLVRPPGMSLNAIRQGISLWNGNLIVKKGWGAFSNNDGDDDDVDDVDAAGVSYRSPHKKNAAASANNAADSINQKPARPVSEAAALEAPHNKSDQQLARQHASADSFWSVLFPVAQCESVQVKAKALADEMEALIGGFYVEGGLRAGVAAIKALGAWPQLREAAGGGGAAGHVVTQVASNESAGVANTHDTEIPAGVSLSSAMDVERNFSEGGLASETAQNNENSILETPFHAAAAVDGGGMVFPDNFPEPLKRIALGHTLDLTRGESASSTTATAATAVSTPAAAGGSEDDLLDSDNVSQVAVSRRSLWSRRGGTGTGAEGVGAVTQAVVDAIALAIGYTFRHWSLLDEALTHGSVQHKRSNQRLEFLGDAVLDFAVVSLLFKHQPWAKQGDLSAQKSAATNNKNLGQFGARLQLYRYLNLCSELLEQEFLKLDSLMNGEDWSNNVKYHNSSGGDNSNEESAQKRMRTERDVSTEGVPSVAKSESIVGSGSVSPAVESFLHGFTTSSEGFSAEPMAEEKLRAITACIRSPKVIPMGAGTTKTLADTFEALVAAVYLDSGGNMDVVSSVIRYINLLPQLA